MRYYLTLAALAGLSGCAGMSDQKDDDINPAGVTYIAEIKWVEDAMGLDCKVESITYSPSLPEDCPDDVLCVDRKDSIKWYSADQEAYAIYFAPFDSRRLRSKRSGFTQRFKVWSKSPDLFYKYSIWKDGCPEEDILDPHIRVGDPEGDPTSGPLRPVPPAPPVPDPEVDPGP